MAAIASSDRDRPAFGLPPQQRKQVGAAALIIGLAASAGLVAITPYNDNLLMNTWIAGNHFPIGAFAVLLVMTLVVNTALRKLSSGLALPPGQLIAIWALVLVSSGLPSSGLMRYFVPNLPSYHYYASPENKWDELFGDKIPPALIVQDPMAVKGFFEGLPPGRSIPWAAWARPVMAWGIYAFALYAMMIGAGKIYLPAGAGPY